MRNIYAKIKEYKIQVIVLVALLSFLNSNLSAQHLQLENAVIFPEIERIDSAILKSLDYFEERGTRSSRNDVNMILSILPNVYEVEVRRPHDSIFMEVYPQLQNSYFRIKDSYYRGQVEPFAQDIQYLINYLASDPAEIGMDLLTAWSFYCPFVPKDERLFNGLWVLYEKGGYPMTHAAYQASFLLRDSCWLKQKELILLINKASEQMAAIADDPSLAQPDVDLTIESILFLMYLQKDELIKPEWIDYILEYQLEDGGWPQASYLQSADDHSSVLGLWVLLEYKEFLVRSRN